MRAVDLRRAARAALVALCACAALPAFGHANLVRSVPEVGAVLASAPTTAEMEFSEDVNPASARVALLDAQSARIATGTVTAVSRRALRVQIPAQPDGVYSISWQVRSALDGHQTVGSIAFSVGASAPRASLLPPIGAPDPTEMLPPPLEALLRAIGYISLALILGAGFFGSLAWRPAFRALGSGLDAWEARATGILRSAVRIGAGGTALSVLGLVALRIGQAGAGGPAASLWLRASQGISPREAVMFAARLALVSVAAVLVGPALRRWTTGGWWATAAVGILIVGTYSLASHNAATGSVLPVAADWLHASAMSAWIGGLAPFGLLLFGGFRSREEGANRLLVRVVERFSRVAFTSVMIIGVTGLYMTFLQVRTFDGLLHDRYGQSVLVKIGLFGILFAFGAINELWIMPRMSSAAVQAFGRFVRTVSTESVIALGVLATAGTLTCCTPAYIAIEESRRLGYHERASVDRVQMDLRIAPARVGDNEFGVDIVDRRSGAAAAAPTVLLRLGMAGESVTEVKTTAASGTGPATGPAASGTGPAAGERFTARGSYLSMEGAWRVKVILRKPGSNDVTHDFQVRLAAAPASAAAGPGGAMP
jgi:putative copper export protein/methionine-rich copper-binding protein CopC